jgi:hypothetical protein
MTRRAQENLVALLFLALFVAIIWISLGYGPRARMVPIPIATMGILLCIAQLVWQNRSSVEDLKIDMFEFLTGDTEQPEQAVEAETPKRASFRNELAGIGVVLLLLAMYLVLTPLPAIFLFTAGYFVLSRHYSPARGILYAALFTAVIYVVFGRILHIPLDQSIFGTHYELLWFL